MTSPASKIAKMKLTTLREMLYWSYANLAMAHAAVSDEASAYRRKHFMVRSRLYAGLTNGKMNVGSIADDERLKMVMPQACAYCGSHDNLSVDHVISRKRGGSDSGDNLIWSCRSCNSSKGARDLLEWMSQRDEFPPLLLLRRYLKLAISYSDEDGILDVAIDDGSLAGMPLPFALDLIPRKYPAPLQLKLWTVPL